MIIETHALGRSYGPVAALTGLDLQVRRGEVVGLLGPNGAGKTTALKLLTGLLAPTTGWVKIAGHDLQTARRRAQAAIGYLPESAPVYPELIVQEYLLWVAELRGLAAGERAGRVRWAAALSGLEPKLTARIGALSKGYRQRLGIAQAILHRPALLILDEPTSGLDPAQMLQIRGLIRGLAEHSTVLLSSHRLPEVEAVADRALILIEGRLRADLRLGEAAGGEQVRVCFGPDAPPGVEASLRALPGVAAVSPASTDTDGPPRVQASLQAVPGVAAVSPARDDDARAEGASQRVGGGPGSPRQGPDTPADRPPTRSPAPDDDPTGPACRGRCFQLTAEAGAAPLRPRLFALAAREGWPLVELTPVRQRLSAELFSLLAEDPR